MPPSPDNDTPLPKVKKTHNVRSGQMAEGIEPFSTSHHVTHSVREAYIRILERVGEIHKFNVDNLPEAGDYAHEALPQLYEVVQFIIRKATAEYEEDDLVSLEIIHPEWPENFSLPFDAMASVDAEQIMNAIEHRFLQNQNFNLYGDYTFLITCVGKYGFKPDKFVSVKKVSEKKVRKFGVQGLDYEIKVNGLEQDVASAADAGFKIEAILEHVITKITDGQGSNAMARLVLMHPALDKPVSLPFKSISELKASDIITQISKIIQSKSEFDLSLGFTVNIVIVQLPYGGRNLRVCSNWEQFKKDSRCIIRIINTKADERADRSEICCARAIVVGQEYADGGPDMDSNRRTNSGLQRERAIRLHQSTGVPMGPCGLREIQIFQDHFEGSYQINVISIHQNFERVFSGSDLQVVQYRKRQSCFFLDAGL